jgi:tetratricopeptide (TPR) repeat protein
MSDEVHSAPAGQQESKTPAHLHPLSAAYSAVARAWTWLRSQGPPLLSRCTKFIVHNFNTLVVKLPGAIIVVFILWMVIRGLTEHVTVIEPLSVPKQLEDRGYTPEVAGKHMRDAIDKFASAVNTTMKNPEIALQGELPNIVVPTVGISLDAIVASIRTMLRSTRSRSITGEFTSLGNQLWLRLRLDGHQIYTSPAGDLEKPDELLAGAAPEILKIIQPYFAAAAMRNGNPTGALALADAVIKHRPESDENVPWLYNLKGSILYDSGDYLAARSAAEKALTLDPGLAGAHLNLGVLSGAEGDHQSAMSEYAKAVRTNPEIPAGHNNVAVELNNKGDVDGAIGECQNAINLEPNYALAHHNLGNVMRSLKKDHEAASEYAEAVDQYRRHLDTNPKDAATHLGLAAVLRAQGDAAGATAQLQAAVAQFTDIVQSEPKNLVARRYVGDALEGLQKYDDAAAAYQEALEIKPDAVAVRFRRAEALQMAKKYDAAAAEYREVIKAEPKYAAAHNELGSLLGETGKHDDAIAEYRAAIAIDPRVAAYHDNLGSALAAARRSDEAIAEYRKALEVKPNDAVAYMRWGIALGAAGKRDEAIVEYRSAVAAEPNNAVAHYDLGLALRLSGKLDEAAVELRSALAINPNYLAARESRHRAAGAGRQGRGHRRISQDFGCRSEQYGGATQIEGIGRSVIRHQ